jgi:hypothetical protein
MNVNDDRCSLTPISHKALFLAITVLLTAEFFRNVTVTVGEDATFKKIILNGFWEKMDYFLWFNLLRI